MILHSHLRAGTAGARSTVRATPGIRHRRVTDAYLGVPGFSGHGVSRSSTSFVLFGFELCEASIRDANDAFNLRSRGRSSVATRTTPEFTMTSVSPMACLERAPGVEGRLGRHNARRPRHSAVTPRAASGRVNSGCHRAISVVSGTVRGVRRRELRGVVRTAEATPPPRHRPNPRNTLRRPRFAVSNALASDGHGGSGSSSSGKKTSPLAADPARGKANKVVITTEEDADLDANSRLSRLKALVARKRLYFAILEAAETVTREIPEKGDSLEKAGALVRAFPTHHAPLTDCPYLYQKGLFPLTVCPYIAIYSYQKGRLPSDCLSIHRDIQD